MLLGLIRRFASFALVEVINLCALAHDASSTGATGKYSPVFIAGSAEIQRLYFGSKYLATCTFWAWISPVSAFLGFKKSASSLTGSSRNAYRARNAAVCKSSSDASAVPARSAAFRPASDMRIMFLYCGVIPCLFFIFGYLYCSPSISTVLHFKSSAVRIFFFILP